MKYLICFLVYLQILYSTSGFRFKQNNKIVCRNEITGQELDWYTLYKLPKLHSDSIELVNNGTAYLFMTNEKQNWFLSSLSINSTQSFPAKTLEILYKHDNNSDLGYILYSDQADEVTFIKGHAKGVILFDENSAVWIVHSIPHYPPKKNDHQYFIRPAQCYFGQSMLCMSFSFDQLELIGQQLLFTYPQVYDYFIPDKFKNSKSYSKILSNLMRVINNEHVEQKPWYSAQKLTTLGGEEMISFSKYTEFEDDLYSGLVAPTLKSDLLTETWVILTSTNKKKSLNDTFMFSE
jgi:deoxyribonuclease-2